jgi:hypothetical protein
MDKIKTKPGLLNFFAARAPEVREYFDHVPRLVSEFPLKVALAYVFAQVELAHSRALYCGVVKLHHADSNVASNAVNTHHVTRGEFRQRYEIVYGEPIPDTVVGLLTYAEAVRDRVMHGKSASDDDMRNAIAHVLAYAEDLNKLTVTQGGPKPFGDLRGFKGAAQGLDKSTSRWLLKGMGFAIK